MLKVLERIFRRTSWEQSKLDAFHQAEKVYMNKPGVRGVALAKHGVVIMIDDDAEAPLLPESTEEIKYFTQRVSKVNLLNRVVAR